MHMQLPKVLPFTWTLIKEKTILELKPLPPHLKYVFLEGEDERPAIISSTLPKEEEKRLEEELKKYKKALGWQIYNLKGISPSICMHNINLEEDIKQVAQPQRRLNSVMKEEFWKEILKLLEAGMIYAIPNSSWESPVQVVPQKGGITIIKNDKNELILVRIVTSWKVCIDYCILNQATRKDHFPLLFMDWMLERLAGQAFYCFLDGCLGYNQILVNLGDQERTTFTCPFGVFAY